MTTAVFFTWIWLRLKPTFSAKTGFYLSGTTSHPLFLIPISFVFFMFLSYSFFSKEKLDKLDETIAAAPGGTARSYLSGFFVLCSVDLLLLALVWAYHIYCCQRALGYWDTGIVLFGLRCYVVHIFLVNIFSILVGLAATFCKSEPKAYALMAAVNCFFSQFFLSTLYTMAGMDKTAYQAADLFALTTRMYYAGSDEDYVISIEGIEWQRVLFWIFLCLAIILFHILPKKKIPAAVCSGALAALCLCLYMLPTGAYRVDDSESNQDAWREERSYYEQYPEYVGTEENYHPDESFRITKYVAELAMQKVLKAKVTVYVDQDNLDEYVFALRHEYQVTDVRDEQGQALPFTQRGDWVEVQAGSGMPHTCFTLFYRGASQKNLSTSQAVRLPAYFAYLPFSGKRYLYFSWSKAYGVKDEETQRMDEAMGIYDDTDYLSYTGPVMEGPGYEAEYELTVKSTQKVYCNLPEVGRNHFRGRSDGVTLAASAFLRKKEIAGAFLVYSIGRWKYAPADTGSTIMEEWEAFIRENGLQGKTIFVSGVAFGLSEEDRYFGKNHLVLQSTLSADAYQWFLKTGEISYNDGYLPVNQ